MVALHGTTQHESGGTSVVDPPSPTNCASRQAAIAELGQTALRGASVGDVFDLALDLARVILDVDYAKILQQADPGERLILVSGQGWPEDVRVGETTVSCDQHLQAGYTLLVEEPVLVHDVASETRFAPPPLLVDHGVVSGMSVIIPDRERPYGVLGVHTRRRRRFTADDGDFLRSVANVVGGAIQHERFRQEIQVHSQLQERRLRYEAALSMCARALLSTTGDALLEHAVEALLTATEATYVFVERNVTDDRLGFCSKTVVEVEAPGSSAVEGYDAYWALVPWSQMPVSRQHLERGEPFIFLPEELEGVEHDLYAASPVPIKSELDIPIFVGGKWAGLIAFADDSTVREWTAEDLSLLTTVATMIGAHWEREIVSENREAVIRSKDDILASVGHELRTPLAAVLGFGQILQDEAGSLSVEEHSELAETVVRQATDLTNIVSDLLVAAKTDTGKLQVTRVSVNLRAQTAQALEAFEHDQVGHISLVGQSTGAVGDPQRVRQIIRNLISNALRYGGESIHVDVSGDASVARVLVCDNGVPIPEEDRERIFEQYQRARNAVEASGSLGLGLAISRQLARRMGGDLVYRYANAESIFELTLPTAG